MFVISVEKSYYLCKLILYPATLLNLFIISRSFQVEILESIMYSNMSFENIDKLASFPIYISLIFFSCLIFLASTSSTT